ncbi:MAG: hypothetical protein GF398_17975 [Chitinivibrionales bacterium]|nr:hypothetical protein [Chitinivibrionales bacterium]
MINRTLISILVLLFTVQAANNSRSPLGINLQGVIDWSTELVFLDQMKRARSWISQCKGCGWDKGPALDLDEHGWIKSFATDQFAELILATHPLYIPGEYKVFYDGTGRMKGSGMAQGEITASGDILTFKDPAGGGGYCILTLQETDPTNYIRNIRIVHTDKVAAFEQGEIFYEQFLENWAPYRTIRFMDWAHTNNSVNGDWDKRPHVEDYTYGTKKGVPFEIMIELCNRLQAWPWFCIPHQADDAFVRNMAQLVKEKLDPSLAIYLEHSNEVWNGNFQEQFQYAVQKGKELGLKGSGSDFDGLVLYHAQRSAEIVQIWEEVLGSRERLIGVFAVGGPKEWMIKKGMGHLKSIGKQSYIDVAGIAPYVGADGSFSTVNEAIKVLQDGLPKFRKTVTDCKAAAEDYGVRLVGYEGGSHLWNFGQGFSEVAEEAQADPRMRQWVLDYMKGWKENGGDEFMVFASGGGFWGQIPWDVAPEQAPKYQGHLEFIDQNPVWWEQPWSAVGVLPYADLHEPGGRILHNQLGLAVPVLYDLRGRLVGMSRQNRVSLPRGIFLKKESREWSAAKRPVNIQ